MLCASTCNTELLIPVETIAPPFGVPIYYTVFLSVCQLFFIAKKAEILAKTRISVKIYSVTTGKICVIAQVSTISSVSSNFICKINSSAYLQASSCVASL